MKICAAVLAGGHSKRMGSDKTQLQTGCDSLLDHMINTLKRVSHPQPFDDLLVSGTCAGYRSVPDLKPEKGPLGGIYSIIKFLRTSELSYQAADYLLIVPVDMPGLSVIILEQLLSRIAKHNDLIWFCSYQLPLLLKTTAGTEKLLANLVEADKMSRDCSIRALIQKIEKAGTTEKLPVENNQAAFVNINTPQEWEQYLERFNQ